MEKYKYNNGDINLIENNSSSRDPRNLRDWEI